MVGEKEQALWRKYKRTTGTEQPTYSDVLHIILSDDFKEEFEAAKREIEQAK